MKELPILFSTPMVQANIEGRKTMTRRIVKTNQKGWDCQNMEFVQSENISESFFENRTASPSLKKELTGFHAFFKDNTSDHKLGIKCPYGQPGDVLWVRETWCVPSLFDGFESDYYFKAGFDATTIENKNASQRWHPSIHMPKAAARIWLQVEEIRVERLQEISWEDAIAEGIHVKYWGGDTTQPYAYRESKPEGSATDYQRRPTQAFEVLWCKINGPESWDLNPWVWVVKFKVLSTTGKLVSELLPEREAVERAVEGKPSF